MDESQQKSVDSSTAVGKLDKMELTRNIQNPSSSLPEVLKNFDSTDNIQLDIGSTKSKIFHSKDFLQNNCNINFDDENVEENVNFDTDQISEDSIESVQNFDLRNLVQP